MIRFDTVFTLILACSVALTGCSSKLEEQSAERAVQVADTPSYMAQKKYALTLRTNSAENQVLIRLVRNLEEMESLVNEAQFRSNPDSRIHFDYRQLRSDLLAITQGIRTHLRTPDYSPRTLKPIPGNYGH